MKITIVNSEEKESGRVLRIDAKHYNKLAGVSESIPLGKLSPGESTTYEIHLLKDLVISEFIDDPDFKAKGGGGGGDRQL